MIPIIISNAKMKNDVDSPFEWHFISYNTIVFRLKLKVDAKSPH